MLKTILLLTVLQVFLVFNLKAQETESFDNKSVKTISAISRFEGTSMTWPQCADTCHNLIEGGFDDWRMPYLSEAIYGRIAFDPPDGSWCRYIWTATPFTRTAGVWILMNESNGNWDYRDFDNPSNSNSCRCVR